MIYPKFKIIPAHFHGGRPFEGAHLKLLLHDGAA